MKPLRPYNLKNIFLFSFLFIPLFAFCQPPEGTVSTSNNPGSTPPAPPPTSGAPGGGGSTRPTPGRPIAPGANLSDVLASYNNNFKAIETYFDNVQAESEALVKIYEVPSEVQIARDFPLAKSHYQSAIKHVSQIKQLRLDLKNISDRGVQHYSNDIKDAENLQTRLEQENLLLKNELNNLATVRKSIDQLPNALTYCRSQSKLRTEQLELKINKYNQLIANLRSYKNWQSSQAYYVLRVTKSAIFIPIDLANNYVDFTKKVLIKTGKVLTYIDPLKLPNYYESIMKKAIEEGRPISDVMLDDIVASTTNAKLRRELLLGLDPNNTIGIIKEFEEIEKEQKDIQSEISSRNHYIEQIRKIRQIQQEEKAVVLQVHNASVAVLKSKHDIPTIITYTEVPPTEGTNIEKDLLIGYTKLNNSQPSTSSTVSEQNRIDLIKQSVIKLQETSNNNLNILKNIQPDILPILKTLITPTIADFNVISSRSTDILNHNYRSQGGSNGLLTDFHGLTTSYLSGITGLRQIRKIQQVFKESEDDLNALGKVIYARDAYYQNLLNNALIITEVKSVLDPKITTKNSTAAKYTAAHTKVQKIIRAYYDYTGNDSYTLALNSIRKVNTENTGIMPNQNEIAMSISEEIDKIDNYKPDLFYKLYQRLENISINGTFKKSEGMTPMAMTNLEKTKKELAQFEKAKKDHRDIFSMINSGIHQYLQVYTNN